MWCVITREMGFHRWPVVGVLVLLAGFNAVTAQQSQTQRQEVDEMLERLFASDDFAEEWFGPARWLASGDAYTTLEPSATVEGAIDIVRYDARTGARSVLVGAQQLTPDGSGGSLDIADYSWSSDGNRLLIFTNTAKVWRDHTRGDYWVLDRASGELRKLGGRDAKPSTLMFAKFSPDGGRVGYVREGDIYVENLRDGSIVRLTAGASRTTVNGTTDWVYEEEFQLRDAFRWSPDGSRIAYWQFDMSGVREFLMVNNTDSLYAFTVPVQYPKAGSTNSAVRAGVVSANGGPTTWLQLPGDPRDDYLPRMEWAAKSSELVLQRMNRLQNTNRVMLADASTGAVREILLERDSAWLDVVNDLTWINNGRRFLWVSERDGWRHVYSVARNGSDIKLLTPGDYDVMNIVSIDENAGYIYFTGSIENPTQRYLYRVRLTGGRPELVTPATEKGWHGYSIAPGARFAFHTQSSFDVPPTTSLIQLPNHRNVRTLVSNDELREQYAPLAEPAFFRVNVGDRVELDGWMIKPHNFDPARKYPLLMLVYTEPWGATAVDRWAGTDGLWHRLLADQGYIVATVDNRGTPSPRGRAWRKVVYGEIGVLSSREQAEAVRVLTRQHAWLDSTRVGIWGWSGGGSATLNAMFRYPDVYQVGMAVAPVPDMHLYDTVYQERYMGLPQVNTEGYRLGSPINFAEGLKGKLLIVHGTGDDNVHYQGTERLVDRLIGLGKQFDLEVYPNRSHCICEGPGTTLHVYTRLTNFLLEHLPVDRPTEVSRGAH